MKKKQEKKIRTTRWKSPEERREAILETFRKTGTIRGTSRTLQVSINTVRRVLRGQDGPKAPRPESPRPSKLDPYKARIRSLVQEDKLTAILVLEEIRKLGYNGGYSILKEYVRQVRPSPRLKVTTLLEHPPGEEAQVDWSPYRVMLGGVETQVHAFSMVLCWSRYSVVRFALDEQLPTLLQLHDEAFSVIGGHPALMTYDNMTTVGRHVSKDKIWLNPRFEAYAKECGFEVRLIDPGCPDQHGPVERNFQYVENNCLLRRRSRFDSFEDLQQHVRWWCDEVANVRVHGTTRERPVDRLVRERPLLRPLSSSRPEPFQLLSRGVGNDFCVAVDTNRYSVPPRCVGQAATVRLYENRLEVLVGGSVVGVHLRCSGRHQRRVLPEHEEAFKRATPSRRLLEQAFLRLGPVAETYYEGLRTQRGRGAGYHLQRILKLADRHGTAAVTGAMAHAAKYGNYSADAIARVLSGRAIPRRTPDDHRDAPVPTESVQKWLEGIDVEGGDLEEYDRIIDGLGEPDKENDDGQG